MTDVVVAVVTYRRPDDLAALLPLLEAEARDAEAGHAALRVAIQVVDNDPGGSAGEVAGRHPGVRYAVEPVPGISAARNRALALAADAELLAFIDDDERPAPGWLAALLGLWSQTGAHAVCGPVRTQLPSTVDPWVLAGRLFIQRHRAHLPAGSEVASAPTNNLLLNLEFVRSAGLRFDGAFGISGGSDELFTRRLRAAGGRIVWCPDAVVEEAVRPERLDRRFLLRRTYSYGNIDSRIEQALAGSAVGRVAARMRCSGSGLARIGYGFARWLYGRCVRSLPHQALGSQTLLRGLGLVTGSAGIGVDRYRRRRPIEAPR